MKTIEVNADLVGKRCKCLFLNKMVTGTITKTMRNKHCVQVCVHFDTPQFFKNEKYKNTWIIGWLNDYRSGSLDKLELFHK
jgi:hypothetical protein